MNPEVQSQIRMVNAAISRVNGFYDKWAHRYGVNSFTIGIFYTLLTEGPFTQKQFCEDFEVPKQSINNVITVLKNDGYIALQPSKEDKREKIIVLTDRGHDYATELLAPLFKIEEAVVGIMGERLMAQLIKSTTAFGDLLEQEMEKERNV